MKISVVTPCLNASDHIEVAIRSVMGQSYPYYEHVVVDGGSNDGTVGILERYPHLIWVSEPDSGQSNAMNKGFDMTTGDIVVYLNADDYFLPDAFATVIPHFEHGARFVVGDVLVKMDGGYFLNSPRTEFREMVRHWEPNAFPNNPVGYFYTRDIQQSLPFNEDNHLMMDVEFLLDASLQTPFTKINEVLGVYRAFGDTKTLQVQVDPDYWQESSFRVLDRFVTELPEAEQPGFLADRAAGLNMRREEALRSIGEGLKTA
ncbi:MAG: glycosyltransferase family 2 protein [Pseudomonadota bacterium]